MKSILLFALLIFSQSLHTQEIGSLTDERDGQVYKTVTYKIKDGDKTLPMTWMIENLNYEIEGSYCRDDSIKNCETMGRLYLWAAAIKACPQGWHLPSNDEWLSLADLYGGVDLAGVHLKSTSDLWDRGGKGSNKSLFNAMPFGVGAKPVGYHLFGRVAIFWSSSIKDERFAWDWKLSFNRTTLVKWPGPRNNAGNSVRCIQD